MLDHHHQPQPPRPRKPTRELPKLPQLDVPPQAPSQSAESEISSSPLEISDSSAGSGARSHPSEDSQAPNESVSKEHSNTRQTSDALLTPQNGMERKQTPPTSTELTALRAHYLKKALVELEFERELDALTTYTPNGVSPLSYLGPPFSRPPRDAPALALPFLRFVFRQFVLTFPFLASAPKDFFPDKLQPFIASVGARNLSPTSIMDDADPTAGDAATRVKLQHKVQRNLALFVGAATKITEPEDVVRLTQADLDRLEALARRRREREKGKSGTFEVNIVCVRAVVERGRVRSKAHDEFIIRTRRSGQSDIFVSRRYGDFKTLADELRKAYPDAIVPQPPGKDRSGTDVASHPASPTSPSLSRMPTSSSLNSNFSMDSLQPPSPTAPRSPYGYARLAREKNRLTLRAYLHSLMASSTFTNSPQLRSFLTAGPTRLSPEEELDARRREEADALRDDGRKRFAREIADRVDGLRDALRSVKGEMMGKDGLTHIFAVIKTTENVRDLPKEYEAVLEWARMSIASTVFQNFVAADNASENLASLKRIHGLMPYFMLKTALKISNPVGMIRSVLDLFMAQPFGKQSLLQRMFTSSLMEEVKEIESDILAVEDKVDDPVMCEKVKIFINSPKEIQSIYKMDADTEKINILAAVLRSPEAPALSRAQMHRAMRSHRAHVAYMRQKARLHDSDDDEGPEDEDAWLFEDLTVLGKLYARLRDRQQIIELVFEGTTAELLKDIITIFYAPLAQVYKAASIADSIGDLQNFVTDMIRTVEQLDESTQANPQQTVKIFVDLIRRHEQPFYHFVHKVHSKGENLFDGLMHWIELFLTITREGLAPEPISLEFLLPHAHDEREKILHEVDAIAHYHYKLKVAYEEKLRRRFGRAQENKSSADAEDEAAQALVNGVVDELSFGELMQGAAMDVAAADTDESSDDDDDDDEYDSETGSETDSDYNTAGEDENTPVAVGRSRTIGHTSGSGRPPVPHRSSSQRRPEAGSSRKNDIRPARSMTFSPSSSRGSVDRDIPPVPPLPAGVRTPTSPYNKPLPPDPAQSSHLWRREPPPRVSHEIRREPPPRISTQSERLPTRDSMHNDRRRPQPQAQLKRPGQEGIKPPHLVHIPNLLPIFVEMMRPGLEPRQLS